ncbi:hypothetical protein, conserved [Eimeria necatrix]|uniref:Mediator of RNA polymerase II transcription subunit 21 n=1 Tax=Eimeria necatrix TaxID=51315 RepID=U6MGN2_9EIME|nr:hypothetical protein, conserved [Eimeria necatrix]CDJ63176.1 hypothetical protein, conserved [Eimeria necatrix]
MAPPRSVSGSVDVSESSETSATSNVVIRTAMTEEQLNEFILSCSKGVGTLVHTIEEEIEKLPEGVQSQDEIESQIRYLEEENEAAAAELKQLVAAVRSVREALRTAYREAATDGTRITID